MLPPMQEIHNWTFERVKGCLLQLRYELGYEQGCLDSTASLLAGRTDISGHSQVRGNAQT